jgi:hypothetical protein
MEYACDEIKFCSQQLLVPGPSGLGVAARGGKYRTRWGMAMPNAEHLRGPRSAKLSIAAGEASCIENQRFIACLD